MAHPCRFPSAMWVLMPQVAELHAQFLHAMEELFIKHRKEAGYDLSQLKVL